MLCLSGRGSVYSWSEFEASKRIVKLRDKEKVLMFVLSNRRERNLFQAC